MFEEEEEDYIMGCEEWKQKVNPILKVSFYISTLTLLSLLHPLSFLLLARLSYAKYPLPPSSNFLLSLLLNISPGLLQSLLSLFGVMILVDGVTGKCTSSSIQPRLHIAWIFISVQITVGWGTAIVVPGVWPDEYGADKRSFLISRIIFYIGLHETMLHWANIVIRAIEDCKVFGGSRSEKWEKAAISSGFGALWWWSLKDKVETIALVVEIKRELLIGLGISDFINWWLYYLTFTIGVLRVVKCFIWFAKGLFYRRPQDSNNNGSCEDDNKVLHHPLLPTFFSIQPSPSNPL